MARSEYSGVPDVAPSLEAPQDYERVEAPPASFGGAIAEGAERAGQGFLQLQGFYEETAANNALNDYLHSAQKIINGQPGAQNASTGADGTVSGTTPALGFLGLHGANAMAGFKPASDALDEAAANARESLTTPMAQKLFDADSRRYRAQYLNEMSAHRDQQQFTWMKDTNNTAFALALNGAASNPMNDTTIADATARARQAMVRNAQIDGEDPAGGLLKADQAVTVARIHALVGNNQGADAAKVLDQSRGVLGSLSNYDEIVRTVKGAEINQEFAPAVDQAVQAALLRARPAGTGGLAAVPKGTPPPTPPGGALHFQAPVSGPISSGFGERARPTAGASTEHWGVDYAVPVGTPVAAAANGVVEFAGQRGGYGNAVVIKHADGSTTLYGHLSTIGVKAGQQVQGGEQIAASGATGTVTGPNLHFGRYDAQGRPINPNTGQVAGGPVPSGKPYMSAADNLTENMPSILDDAHKFAENKWPSYPDVQERYVDAVQRGVSRQITQQDDQSKVDQHIVLSAMVGPNAPISEDELVAKGGAVAAAWQRLQIESPYTAISAQNMFKHNAEGVASHFGTEFKGYLDRVLAPDADPGLIKNPTDLMAAVGGGPAAPLTNSGAGALSGLMKIRGTPQGEAGAAQIKQFLDGMHGELTFSNPGVGRYDVQGEARYVKFASAVLPLLERAYKDGSLAKVLDPHSPDYLGKAALPFMRTRAAMMRDAVSDPGFTPQTYTVQSLDQTLSRLDNRAQQVETVNAALANKTLTPEIYRAYLAAKTPPPAAKAPVLTAPAPAPASEILGRPDVGG